MVLDALGFESMPCDGDAASHSRRSRGNSPVARREKTEQTQQQTDPQRTVRSAQDFPEMGMKGGALHVSL